MNETGFRQSIYDLLARWRGLDSLKELFWTQLNYGRVNQPVSTAGWPQAAAEPLGGAPLIFGEAGEFKILYVPLAASSLRLTDERAVANRLLRDFPYALLVFSDRDQKRWHLVNVKEGARAAQEDEVRRRRLLFRRIALGPEERVRTAAERIDKLDVAKISPTLRGVGPLVVQKAHDTAFDVEAVTEEFFSDYRKVFADLQRRLTLASGDAGWSHDYALQLLNRLLFLYFIQRKRWLGHDPDFVCNFWQAYRGAGRPPDSFYGDWLSVLFFEAFNQQFVADRSDRSYLPPKLRDALALAPFLNGGLFTRNALDQAHTVTIQDSFFELLFDRFESQTPGFLERYNFTITEDTPFDQEVAVDPEMIGKVYESLVNITSEGVDESDQRGSAGIFYTPRVEIDLMCRLALVDYLTNHLGEERRGLVRNAVFSYDPDEKADADAALAREDLWPALNLLLREATFLDLACGSGSFLVGMLGILDDLQARANQQLGTQETTYERRKRIIGQSLYGVDVMPWAVHVAELRLWLQLVVETELHPAELKFRPLLPNLSFKVRPGDSLVQEVGGINFSLHRRQTGIPAYLKGELTKLKGEKLKFYHGDTSGKYHTEAELKAEELALFRQILDARGKALEDRIKIKRRKAAERSVVQSSLLGEANDIYDAKAVREAETEAEALEVELDQVKQAIAALRQTQEVPFVWDIAFVEIFEGEGRGFDMVAGNPPYVRQEKIAPPGLREEDYDPDDWRELKRVYKAKLQASVAAAFPRFFEYKPQTGDYRRKLEGKSDLYIYFFLHGLSLLNPQGAFVFITSNSWLDVGYGADLQEFLLRHGHVSLLIDNQVKRSFKQADVNTVIALLGPVDDSRAAVTEKAARFVMFRVPFEDALSPVVFAEIEEAAERLTRPEFRVIRKRQGELLGEGLATLETSRVSNTREVYAGNKWGGKYLRAPDIYFAIMEMGHDKLVRLGDVAQLRRGLTTGANDWFFVRVEGALPGDLVRIRCDDSERTAHTLEARFVRCPVVTKAKEVEKPLVNDESLPYRLVLVDAPKTRIPPHLSAYIAWGEAKPRAFHIRATCAQRANSGEWYRLGQREGPHLVIPIGHKRRPMVGVIEGAQSGDNLVEVRLKDLGARHAIAACIFSTFTVMNYEIYGRANFGQGLLKTQTFEIVSLPVLSPAVLEPGARQRLEEAFLTIAQRSPLMLYDDVRRADRIELDDAFLEAVGFVDASERTALVKELHDAVCRLIWQRMAKSGAARESRQTYDEWLASGKPFGIHLEEDL